MSTPEPGRPRDDAGTGWAVLSLLLTGMIVWGAIGWGLDRLLGTSFLVLVGVIVGIALGIYAMYVKYLR